MKIIAVSNLLLPNIARGDQKAADAALADLIANNRGVDYQIAQVYAVRGETDKALEWLQVSFDSHDTGMLALLVDPLLTQLAWRSALQSFGRKDEFSGDIMNEKPSFFSELKRRNVYKVAVAYAVVGWLVIQVTATIVPALHLPDSLTTAVVVLVLVGFPIALVISWAFEMTPEGMKRTADVSADEVQSMPYWSKKKFAAFIIGVLVIAAGLLAYQLLRTKSSPASSEASTTLAISDKSIAVLPLANESGAKDEQYFSDGLSEDLITALSQFAGLKVIGRNSSFQFRDSKDDSKTIGAKLGVAHLLEGSVRRAADAVRISAELVNAADGTTLWSQHYDRPYKDLFKLQDDITTAVANALKAKLLNTSDAGAQSDRPPSGNLEAYNAFLKGNFHFQHDTKDDLRQAIESYQTAVSLDPQVCTGLRRAWAPLKRFTATTSPALRHKQNFAMARARINTALTLNPDLAGAHVAHALLLAFADLDFVGAKTEFERAVQLAPNNLNAVASLAQIRAAFGHPEAAIEPIRQTIATDPWNAGWYGLLTNDLMAVGRLDEAEQQRTANCPACE